jgi:hypothetical protein
LCASRASSHDECWSAAVLTHNIGVPLCHGGTDLLVIEPVRDALEQASGSWTASTPSSATSPRPASPRSPGVERLGEVRVRWIGHGLHAEAEISVDERRTIAEPHDIAESARHPLLHEVPHLASAIIHTIRAGTVAATRTPKWRITVPSRRPNAPTAIADKPPQ